MSTFVLLCVSLRSFKLGAILPQLVQQLLYLGIFKVGG